MKKDQLLLSRLIEYKNSDAVPFHMPGHKRRAESELLKGFPDPYSIDITEIDGFDNLHHPEGILKESMEWAAQVYHADKSYYLINGSSSGILSAICAATHPGGRILLGRNCHKSAYHGVILNYLQPEYIYPQILDDMGIQGGICAADVENLLDKGPLPDAVLIVSPTYDGVVSDIQAIAETVHHYGLPLIVDEAHGAHFSFGNGEFPRSALECGADVVIQSIHKTLPSFTQTAILHVRGERISAERLERYLQMFQSSSPSYIFMAGIENCIYEMELHGRDWMKAFSGRLNRQRQKLKNMRRLKLLGTEVIGTSGVFDLDLSKIVISCRGCFAGGLSQPHKELSGEDLSAWLRKEYHLEMEMCGADYVVAITTFLDREEHLDRLTAALIDIDSQIERDDPMQAGYTGDKTAAETLGEPDFFSRADGNRNICMRPADAMEAETETLPVEQCAGRISAEFIYLYPPGIPMVAPGEQVTEEMVSRVQYYKEIGLPVQGMADSRSDFLKVLIAGG